VEIKIGVQGLAQLSRGLKAIDAAAPKELRAALNSAAQLLIDETRPTIPAVSGAARRSMVARSTRTAARVAVGGKKAPWFPWLDFGGQGRVAGRPAPRPFLKDGRYVYPTLARIRPKIQERLFEAITDVVKNAGLEVDDHGR
jgi:hypothetical protein